MLMIAILNILSSFSSTIFLQLLVISSWTLGGLAQKNEGDGHIISALESVWCNSAITWNKFPATMKKSADTDSKGLVGVLSFNNGSCCWFGRSTWHRSHTWMVVMISPLMPGQNTVFLTRLLVASTPRWLSWRRANTVWQSTAGTMTRATEKTKSPSH